MSSNVPAKRALSPAQFTRRAFVAALPILAAGCVQTPQPQRLAVPVAPPAPDPRYVAMYAAMPDEKFPIPAIDISRVEPKYYRQDLTYVTPEPAGTIIVDTSARFLYLTMESDRAMRYGIGVGREGFAWSGDALINMKRDWPRWTPTQNMMRRDPDLRRYANGMEPGLTNPLGARALYLFEDGRDTLYRLHGTNEPWSIGRAMSSGCIRLFNQDIIHLYERTPLGTRVVVLDHGNAAIA